MKLVLFISLLLAFTLTVLAQAPAGKTPSILNVMKAEQKVSLKEIAGRFEISFYDGIPDVPRYTVKAIEADHLIVEDSGGVNLIHIPVASIKSIVRVKLPGR